MLLVRVVVLRVWVWVGEWFGFWCECCLIINVDCNWDIGKIMVLVFELRCNGIGC